MSKFRYAIPMLLIMVLLSACATISPSERFDRLIPPKAESLRTSWTPIPAGFDVSKLVGDWFGVNTKYGSWVALSFKVKGREISLVEGCKDSVNGEILVNPPISINKEGAIEWLSLKGLRITASVQRDGSLLYIFYNQHDIEPPKTPLERVEKATAATTTTSK